MPGKRRLLGDKNGVVALITGDRMMKVANNRVISRKDSTEGNGRFVCPVPDLLDHKDEHDPQGLVVAILLCVACWVALGFFFLT